MNILSHKQFRQWRDNVSLDSSAYINRPERNGS